MNTKSEIWKLVAKIPKGFVATYGDVGKNLPNPASGFITGKIIAFAEPDVPWWRVVAKDGVLAIGKRDPQMAIEQRNLLQSEGVAFIDDNVDMKAHRWDLNTNDKWCG